LEDLHRCNLPARKVDRANDKVAITIDGVAGARRQSTASCGLVVLVEYGSIAGRGDACRSGRRVDLSTVKNKH
jgi:hypothetical protein